jgi:hypothetical protein
MTDQGDYRLEGVSTIDGVQSPKAVIVYSADERTLQASADGGRYVETFADASSPAAWPANVPFVHKLNSVVSASADLGRYLGYAALVKSLVAGGVEGLAVEETTLAGRPVWQAELPLLTPVLSPRDEQAEAGDVDGSGELQVMRMITVVVDRETGLLVSLRSALPQSRLDSSADESAGLPYVNDAPFTLELSDLEIDADVPDGAFEVREDDVVHEAFSDFADVAELDDEAGFAAAMPGRLPDDFELKEQGSTGWFASPSQMPSVARMWVSWSAVSMGGESPAAWVRLDPVEGGLSIGPDQRWGDPPHPDQVSSEIVTVYRRGLDWVLIRQMPTGPATPSSVEGETLLEEIAGPGSKWGYEERVLDQGVLAGKTAHTWLGATAAAWTDQSATLWPGPGVFVWGETEDDISYLVTGTLTRDELVAIANSLESVDE